MDQVHFVCDTLPVSIYVLLCFQCVFFFPFTVMRTEVQLICGGEKEAEFNINN